MRNHELKMLWSGLNFFEKVHSCNNSICWMLRLSLPHHELQPWTWTGKWGYKSNKTLSQSARSGHASREHKVWCSVSHHFTKHILRYVIFHLLVKTKTFFSSLMKKIKSYINIVIHSIRTIWPYALENAALSHSSGPIRFVNASRDTTARGFLLLRGEKLAARHRCMASRYLLPRLKSGEKWKNVVRREKAFRVSNNRPKKVRL